MNLQYISDLLSNHGELHLVVEEHEAVVNDEDEDYIGIRSDSCNLEYDSDVIHIPDGETDHYIPVDSIVYVQTPGGFPD